jgi:hypothetical protein
MLVRLQSAISLFTCGCLVTLAASPSSIGFVVTSGEAQVDGALVQGNSTLFQGSLVQAGSATSDLMFPGGSNLLLQPGSAVKVYREYAVLQNGTATQRGSHGYALFADGLRVSSLSPVGAVVVGVKDRSHLEVTAQGAVAEVRNPAGALVARLEPGKALTFAIQASSQGDPAQNGSQQSPTSATSPQNSAAPVPGQNPGVLGPQSTVHGILRKDHAGRYGHFLLTDLATNVTYELQGSGLDDLVGGSVEATGSVLATTIAGASKMMYVSDIHQITMSEITGNSTAKTPEAEPPTPSGDTPPASGAGPEVGATPEAKAPPEVSSGPTPPPLPVHNDTAKILIIVGIAAGAGVGVALGLAGGKSSTVSPE